MTILVPHAPKVKGLYFTNLRSPSAGGHDFIIRVLEIFLLWLCVAKCNKLKIEN